MAFGQGMSPPGNSINFTMGRKLVPWGWFSPRSGRNLLAREGGVSREGWFSLEEWKELPIGEKVGSLKRVVFLEETLRPWTMMFLGIGCSTAETRKWGFLGHYRGCFSHEGMGMGPKEWFVSVG